LGATTSVRLLAHQRAWAISGFRGYARVEHACDVVFGRAHDVKGDRYVAPAEIWSVRASAEAAAGCLGGVHRSARTSRPLSGHDHAGAPPLDGQLRQDRDRGSAALETIGELPGLA